LAVTRPVSNEGKGIRITADPEPLLHSTFQTMVNLWIVVASALAATAAALVVRGSRRMRDTDQASAANIGPVSEEWLSNARGQGDQNP
jgi:hypothetical protein